MNVIFERFGAVLESLKCLVNDPDRMTSLGARSLLIVLDLFEFILTII